MSARSLLKNQKKRLCMFFKEPKRRDSGRLIEWSPGRAQDRLRWFDINGSSILFFSCGHIFEGSLSGLFGLFKCHFCRTESEGSLKHCWNHLKEPAGTLKMREEPQSLDLNPVEQIRGELLKDLLAGGSNKTHL